MNREERTSIRVPKGNHPLKGAKEENTMTFQILKMISLQNRNLQRKIYKKKTNLTSFLGWQNHHNKTNLQVKINRQSKTKASNDRTKDNRTKGRDNKMKIIIYFIWIKN